MHAVLLGPLVRLRPQAKNYEIAIVLHALYQEPNFQSWAIKTEGFDVSTKLGLLQIFGSKPSNEACYQCINGVIGN